jgi:hypothetical protein
MSEPSDDTLYIVLVLYGFIFLFAAIFAVLTYVLISIPLAVIFAKAGLPKWKAWVPFYNYYVWLQLGGQNGWWILASLVPVGAYVTLVFLYIAMYRQGIAYGKDGAFVVLAIFLPVIWLFMIAYGKSPYEPERITAAGLGGPLVGYGSVAPIGY